MSFKSSDKLLLSITALIVDTVVFLFLFGFSVESGTSKFVGPDQIYPFTGYQFYTKNLAATEPDSSVCGYPGQPLLTF